MASKGIRVFWTCRLSQFERMNTVRIVTRANQRVPDNTDEMRSENTSETLASFLPETVKRFLASRAHLDDESFVAPMRSSHCCPRVLENPLCRQDMQTVCMFADVSGF